MGFLSTNAVNLPSNDRGSNRRYLENWIYCCCKLLSEINFVLVLVLILLYILFSYSFGQLYRFFTMIETYFQIFADWSVSGDCSFYVYAMQSNILLNLKLIKASKRLTLGIQVGKLHLVRTTDYGSCYCFVME